MTISYQVKDAVYVNLTNRCPCACVFCLRNNASGIYGSGNLWLEREPTREEAIESLEKWDWEKFRDLVFCGYGEPTERLDDLIAISRYMKRRHPGIRIRVNTNGLADLIHARSTAADFEGAVDTLSISLNTDDEKEYFEMCRPKFGIKSYSAMLEFAREAKKHVGDVVMTIVDEPVVSKAKQANCRAICEKLGVRLRIRPFEGLRV